ncbi:MAG: tetratricopeptide repeat protein [Lachnospiraceae bacterium]|nr:tetratricopeptide repeat protein [Lachnospiraceae bacterium]
MSNQNEQVKMPMKDAKRKKDKLPFFIVGGVLLVGIISFIFFMVANATPEAKAKKELAMARQYLDEMEYEMAIASYTRVIEITPKNVAAYEGLANTYVAMAEEAIVTGDIVAAREYFDKAIEALEQGIAETGEQYLVELQITIEEKKKEETGLVCMSVEEILNANVWDEVTYGTYGFTRREYGWKDGKAYPAVKNSEPEEPIEWIVLFNDGNTVTLLSKYILDNWAYNYENRTVVWENSDIRMWLNNEFYSAAFSDEQKSYIQTTTCTNEDNPYFGAPGGHGYNKPGTEEYPAGGGNTQDKVYLLSLAEVEQYFGVTMEDWGKHNDGNMDESSYAELCNEKSNGILTTNSPAGGGGWWWLRSPGFSSYLAANVDFKGMVYVIGSATNNLQGVRPVIRVGM